MYDNPVSVLRRFNRSFTSRIGVLDESFLGTGRPLAVSRLLFEIGLGPITVHELRRRLDADSGYVSRLLRRLEDDHLIELHDDPDDGRRRIATLTEQGERAWADLDRRSDEIARRLIEPLSDEHSAELATALASVQRLLRLTTIALVETAPDSTTALNAMRAYVAELDQRFPQRFDIGDGFEPDVLAEMSTPHGTFIVIDDDGDTVGCGGLRRIDETTAEIKRMWLHPSMRGLGLGKRLLARLEKSASDIGYGSVVLDTNASLGEAISMYDRCGYQRIERYNDNPYADLFFGKELA